MVRLTSFRRSLKVEITRFTCHAMNSVSYGNTMSLKMGLKKETEKLRKLYPNNQSFLSKDLHHIRSGTGEHNREINRARKNLKFQLTLRTNRIKILLAQCIRFLLIWPSTCLGEQVKMTSYLPGRKIYFFPVTWRHFFEPRIFTFLGL